MHTKKSQMRVLPWAQLMHRDRFIGGTIEIFLNRSVVSRLHEFNRGIVQEIVWENGRIAYVRFTQGTCCFVAPHLKNWAASRVRCIHCNQRNRHKLAIDLGPIKDKDYPQRENAWLRDDLIVTFQTLNGEWVALFPRGVLPDKRPFFYKTQREEHAENRRLSRIVTGGILRHRKK